MLRLTVSQDASRAPSKNSDVAEPTFEPGCGQEGMSRAASSWIGRGRHHALRSSKKETQEAGRGMHHALSSSKKETQEAGRGMHHALSSSKKET